jgi:hypothetical protein
MRLSKLPAPALLAALALTLVSPASASEPETKEAHSAQADHEAEEEHAAEDEHEAKEEHHGEGDHGHAHRFLVGAKGTYLMSFPHGEIHHLGGGGVFFEIVLIQRWLEMEFSVKGLTGGHGAVLPIEVLLKIPFHVNEVFEPFVGLGLAVVPSFGEENEVFFGGVAEVGAHIWVHPSWSLLAAVGYGLTYEHGLVNEAAVSLGFAYGW